MKKRILSILLTLCMTLCLTPISVFAEEVGAGGSAAIQLGTDALSVLSKNVNTATAPTVYFGQNHENNPAAWRVIGYDGSGVTSSQGDITLLAAGNMGVVKFADGGAKNKYAPSNLKTAIDALAAKLTTKENAVVKKRTLTSGSYDGENTDCVAGAQVDNAVFWPLSIAEASAVNNDLRIADKEHTKWASSYWWLRSPGTSAYVVAVVKGNGSVSCAGHSVGTEIGVRPAFNLNLNSVLFASAAVGGKPDGGLTPIPEYSGSEIAPITKDYGTEITAPDNPTRKGYTFKGWDKEIPETMPAENITVKAQWEINQYTITFDTNGGSEIAPITQDYGTEITAPDNPTRKGYTFKGWDKEIPETMPAENITITARWKDTEKPTGEIIIGTNKWNEFLNKLTFGIFFKDTQEVTINAVDNSGVVFVSYLVTDKELSEAELNSLVFRAYEEPFSIDPNGEYIIYVMLVDENINITYLRSDRITLDNIQPVISGIENGKTYCEAQTVTVDEKYVDTVTVNGTAVTLDADGGFVLPPTNGEQKIVVTDKSGNNAEMTVTVNNGHTFGEWVSDNDGKHTRKCTVDGCDAFETENCSGGNATCTEKAVCDVCGKAYGEFDRTNHKGGVQEWTTRTAFVHEQKWNCCGAVIVASEAHEWKDGVCRVCGYVCLHNDADKDHVCDYCEKTISEHVDKDKNHICDYCEKTISEHEDATPEEIKKPDTVTAKPDDSKSPQTGDNSNLILWIALLIISGGVMKGVTAFGKSKKHSAKIKDK